MIWKIRNKSKEKVKILGYYCPFYKGGKFKGAYIAEVGEWSDRKIVIANDHIATLLWPKESRRYVWEKVKPQYYGLISKGTWTYKLRIFYQILGMSGIFASEAKATGITIVSETQKNLLEETLLKLQTDWPFIKKTLKRFEGSLELFRTDSYSRHIRTPVARIDFLAEDNSNLILIETKLKKITVNDIDRIVASMKWPARVYGSQAEKPIRAIILCEDASDAAIRRAKREGVNVYQYKIEDDSFRLQPLMLHQGKLQ